MRCKPGNIYNCFRRQDNQRTGGRHGKEISNIFGIEPVALTASEAQYLLGFRTTDELRNRVAKARSERSIRLLAKGVLSESQDSPGEVADTRLSIGYGSQQPIPGTVVRPIGQATVTKAELAQAQAEAELKAAWKNLSDVVRESLRQASLPEEETAESNDGVIP